MSNLITLTLEKPIYGGRSLGRAEDGRAVMVSGGLPGQTVLAQITAEKSRYFFADTIKILQPSKDYCPSPCPYFSKCGGCQWLTMSSCAQDEWKLAMVVEMFSRSFRIDPQQFCYFPSPDKLFYRHRIQLRGTVSEAGEVTVGFFEAGSHSQVAIEKCAIASHELNDLIEFINRGRWPEVSQQKFRLELQILPAQKAAAEPYIFAIIHHLGGDGSTLEPLANALQSRADVLWAGMQSDLKTEPPISPFVVDEHGITYFTSPGAFQQVNLAQNQRLQNLVKTWAWECKPSRICDLYSGSGNLSLQLASSNCAVTAVEVSPLSVEIGRFNAQYNKLKKISFIHSPVERFLKKTVEKKMAFDLIIADPARQGMKESLPYLLNLSAPNLIYVSCDPSTASRDIKILSEKYDVESVAVFDFFPQTYHVETATRLRLR